MTKISPVAEYLRVNKARVKHDNYGCHFISPEGLYLGRLSKMVVNNYKVISMETFGEGFKKMYVKTIAYGQQFIYAKNPKSPLGVSLLPVKTYMRKVFVDFIKGTSHTEDTEKSLKNKLNLIAIDKNTSVGLYDLKKPFEYTSIIKNNQLKNLKNPKYKFTSN